VEIFGIGPLELLFIIILALIVFGPGKLPELGRLLGRTIREFKKAYSLLTRDFKQEFEKELNSETAETNTKAGKKAADGVGPLGLSVNPEIGEIRGNQN
jgi:TatA/E family protein of Tat protein translocase